MQKNERKFDFYYGNEAEQFNFYRIPKVLFTDKRFSKVSVEAKLLYGLLLDRMSLSIKNCWVDEENRVYIYFKLEDAMEFIGIGKDKAVKLFSELDSEKGCGLIIRKKQGLGKPAMIYIVNFSSCVTENHSNTADFKEFHNKENPEAEIAEVLTSEKPNSELPKNPESRLLENRTLDFGISDSNNIEINNIEINNTEINDINPILSYPKEGYNTACPEDEMVRIDEIRKTVRKNIDYELLCQNYTEKMIDGIVEIMVEAICSRKTHITINSEMISQMQVKDKLLELNYMHIEYVLDCLSKNSTKVRNIKNYILTSLYNSKNTIEHYYVAEVNYDLYKN